MSVVLLLGQTAATLFMTGVTRDRPGTAAHASVLSPDTKGEAELSVR